MGTISSKRSRPGFTIRPPAPAVPGVSAMPTPDEIRARIDSREMSVPAPTRENRPLETFNTVSDELFSTMSINPKAPQSPKVYGQIAENMAQLMDDARRPMAPEELDDLRMAVGAYQEAFQKLPGPAQSAILSALPPNDTGAMAAKVFRDFLEPSMDRAPGDTPALRQGRDALLTMEAGDSTAGESASARNLLLRLKNEGVPSDEINEAVMADAFVPPAAGPEQGVFTSRDQFPADYALSSYIGGDDASRLRPSEKPNETSIASELLAPYYAMTNQLDASGQPFRDPVLPNVVGDPVPDRDMLYAGTGEYDGDSDASYRTAQRQMRSQGDDVREELFQRSFGMPARMGRGDRVNPADFERVAPMDLDYIAPYWRANTEQVVDGQIVAAPMTAEELTKTIISQYGFLEEQPALRSAAFELLVPHVKEAMLAAEGTPARYRAADEEGVNYNRNSAGRALLEGLRENAPAPKQPKPYTPDFDALDAMGKRIRESGKSMKPKDNQSGFVQPMGVNKDMMNNRLLSGLFA